MAAPVQKIEKTHTNVHTQSHHRASVLAKLNESKRQLFMHTHTHTHISADEQTAIRRRNSSENDKT